MKVLDSRRSSVVQVIDLSVFGISLHFVNNTVRSSVSFLSSSLCRSLVRCETEQTEAFDQRLNVLLVNDVVVVLIYACMFCYFFLLLFL